MAHREIKYNSKHLTLHKATTCPKINEKRVLTSDIWNYVDLWLKRYHHDKSQFFWQQAKHFYQASRTLNNNSSPLTSYYCILNASKAYLLAKHVNFSDQHGVSGATNSGNNFLSNETIKFKPGGILAELCKELGETVNNEVYTLQNVLYNLPYIHRAFDLSYSSTRELFIPVKRPRIVRSQSNNEAWFCSDLEGKYANMKTVKRLSNHYEKDTSITETYTIRSKKRFRWIPSDKKTSIRSYVDYHRRLRKDLHYINKSNTFWYIKRSDNIDGYIKRSPATLTFAAMHRLSELSRYSPDTLDRHFRGRYNWLLSEFISSALDEFIDYISSELTGDEFCNPTLL